MFARLDKEGHLCEIHGPGDENISYQREGDRVKVVGASDHRTLQIGYETDRPMALEADSKRKAALRYEKSRLTSVETDAGTVAIQL